MTTDAHTPGPWSVHEEAGDQWWFGEHGQLVVRADNGAAWESIAVMGVGPMDRANFRLIAAAPELLAALQEAVARPLITEGADWWGRVYAAIRAATGEQA